MRTDFYTTALIAVLALLSGQENQVAAMSLNEPGAEELSELDSFAMLDTKIDTEASADAETLGEAFNQAMRINRKHGKKSKPELTQKVKDAVNRAKERVRNHKKKA